jgi:phosphinothricin acetyltransferase
MIRPVRLSDADAICGIYNTYVLSSTVTFEESPLTVETMASRIEIIVEHYPWLVYEDEGRVLGYTYARKWRDRSAYRHTVETGTYVESNSVGKGIGTRLKGDLLKGLRDTSIHAVISGIALPNPASIALCEKFGFKKVAHFKEVGYKLEQWVDVGYWQLILHSTNPFAGA